MARIITLATDFGLEDEYVGVMKGVMLRRTQDLTIIDLSHAIERHNIRQAALLIASAYRFFPKQTIHLVVVDPGVGSGRKLILLQTDGHFFLAPDNGVLGLLIGPEHFQAAYEVQCSQYFLTPVSPTFHGRDILAPVAAELAAGLDPEAVGPIIDPQDLGKMAIAPVIFDSIRKSVKGEITGKDHFGNLLTNIHAGILENFSQAEKARARVSIGSVTITGIMESYFQKALGEIVAIVGSRGRLEIAVNQGNAAERLKAGLGDTVAIKIPRR